MRHFRMVERPARSLACIALLLAPVGACMAQAAIGKAPQGFALEPSCSFPEPAIAGTPDDQICYSYPGGEAPDRIVISRFARALSSESARKSLEKLAARETRYGMSLNLDYSAPRALVIDGGAAWSVLKTVKGRQGVERLELLAVLPDRQEACTWVLRFVGVTPRFRNEPFLRQTLTTFRSRPRLPILPWLGGAVVVAVLLLRWLRRRSVRPVAAPRPPCRRVTVPPPVVSQPGPRAATPPPPEPLPLVGVAEDPPAGPRQALSTLPPPSRGVGLASRESFEAQVPAGRLDELWKRFAAQPTRALEQLEALLQRAPEDPRLLHAVCLMRSKACQTPAAVSLATIAIPICLERGEMRLAAEIFAALLPQVRELGLDYRQLVTIGYSLEQMRDRPRAAHAFARALRMEPAGEPAGEGLLRVAEYLAADPATASQARSITDFVLRYGEHEGCLRRAREVAATCGTGCSTGN